MYKIKLDELQLGNQKYKLIAVPDLKEAENAVKANLHGECDFINGVIKYDNARHPAIIEETLIHEILESVKNTTSKCNFTELQMDVIARVIIQALHQFGIELVCEVLNEDLRVR